MRGVQVLVILGGSSPWTVSLLESLEADEVLLVGRDGERLADLQGYFHSRPLLTRVHITTDAASALSEATVVLCQARIGGWAGRLEDEAQPPTWGSYGDETLGLGGLRRALKSRDLIAEWAKASGNATAVVMSNPTDLLSRWWRRHASGHVISACEVPTELLAGLPKRTTYLGVNHVGWASLPSGEIVGTRWVRSLESGVDPELIGGEPRALTLDRLSGRLRSHIARCDSAAYYRELQARPPHWYQSLIVSVLRALLMGEEFQGIVGLPNDGRLPGISSDLFVESLGSLTEALPLRVPDEVLRAVTLAAEARERAWDVLCESTAEAVSAFIQADPFTHAAPTDEVATWLLDSEWN